MSKLHACGIGAMIAGMIMLNSQFAVLAGYLVSMFIIHLVGLSIVLVILFLKKEEKPSKAPPWLYLGGVVGVILIVSNNYCFQVLGASLTMALGITGQTFGSILTDGFGILGVKKYGFNAKKILAITISLLGITLMIDEWQLSIWASLVAFSTGLLILLTMLLNSQLALRVGIFRGTKINYITGLLTVSLLILVSGIDLSGSIKPLLTIPPTILFGGAALGVATVASINFVFPKIPTLYSTLLIVSGQLATGIIIDYLLFDSFSLGKLFGVMLVFSGVALNLLIDSDKSLRSLARSFLTKRKLGKIF